MTPVASRWFFLILAAIGAIAALIPWGYASRRQITQSGLDHAWAGWREAGLVDYDLRVRHEAHGKKSEAHVRVRGGQAREVVRDGEFVNTRTAGLTVDDFFAKLEVLLSAKTQSDYLTADFHPNLGFPVRLVWRPKEGIREEWVLKLDDVKGR